MKIGIRTFYTKDLKKPVHNMEEFTEITDPVKVIKYGISYGIRHFEITCDMNWMLFDSLDKGKISELYKLKEDMDLTYSIHLPYRAVEIAFPDDRVSNAYCDLITDYIGKLKSLEPEAYVVHPTGTTIQKFEDLPADSLIIRRLLKQTVSSINRIIDRSGIDPALTALENLKYPFYNLKELIDETGVSVCMDVGHIIAEKVKSLTVDSFLDEFYDKIIEIHLHDGYIRDTPNGKKSKAHLELGKGDLDFTGFVDELKKRNYSKVVILETELQAAISSYGKITHI